MSNYTFTLPNGTTTNTCSPAMGYGKSIIASLR
jgi:hypothetical protein